MTEQELALENLRLDLERRKHDDDMALRRRELDAQEKREARSAWRSPMFLAVSVGIIGIFGNAVVAVLNGSSERELERQKAEAALILQSLGTGDPDKAGANLQMLLDARLITESANGIRWYLAQRKPGEGAFLLSPTRFTGPGIYQLLKQCVQPVTSPEKKKLINDMTAWLTPRHPLNAGKEEADQETIPAILIFADPSYEYLQIAMFEEFCLK